MPFPNPTPIRPSSWVWLITLISLTSFIFANIFGVVGMLPAHSLEGPQTLDASTGNEEEQAQLSNQVGLQPTASNLLSGTNPATNAGASASTSLSSVQPVEQPPANTPLSPSAWVSNQGNNQGQPNGNNLAINGTNPLNPNGQSNWQNNSPLAPASANGNVNTGQRGGDLAVQMRMINDTKQRQYVEVQVTNQGPNDSTYPLLEIFGSNGIAVLSHNADPLPQDIADGVACELYAGALRCAWTKLAVGQRITATVVLDVTKSGTLTAQVKAQETPDPNPVSNNTATVQITQAEVVLEQRVVPAGTSMLPAGSQNASDVLNPADTVNGNENTNPKVVELEWQINHIAGRISPVDLRVTADRPMEIVAPTCARPSGKSKTNTGKQTVEKPAANSNNQSVDNSATTRGKATATTLSDNSAQQLINGANELSDKNTTNSKQKSADKNATSKQKDAKEVGLRLASDSGKKRANKARVQVPQGYSVVQIGPENPWECQTQPMGDKQFAKVQILALKPAAGQPNHKLTMTSQDASKVSSAISTTVDVTSQVAKQPRIQRLSGPERLTTAIALSNFQYQPQTAGSVVLARADVFADALAGTPLAAHYNAPILLTNSQTLSAPTKEEILRILPKGKTVYILGGAKAISLEVSNELSAAGYVVQRISGPTRYDTAAAIANSFPHKLIVVADGNTFADAQVAAATMAQRQGAVLLTAGDKVFPSTAKLVAQAKVAFGTTAAQATKLPALSGVTPSELSLAVAKDIFAKTQTITVATADTFPDGLAGGPLVAHVTGPLLLIDNNEPTTAMLDWLAQSEVTTAYVIGGTSAVSERTVELINRALTR